MLHDTYSTYSHAVLQVKEISLNEESPARDVFPNVDEEDVEISISRSNVLRGTKQSVRMASLLFINMSGLLPERLEGSANDVELVLVKYELP